jgi:hypothetical protein
VGRVASEASGVGYQFRKKTPPPTPPHKGEGSAPPLSFGFDLKSSWPRRRRVARGVAMWRCRVASSAAVLWRFRAASLLANSLRATGHRGRGAVNAGRRPCTYAPAARWRPGLAAGPPSRLLRISGRPDMREGEGGGAPEGATNSALMRRGARFGRARTPPGAPPRRSLSSPLRRSPAPGRASQEACASLSASSSRPARSGQAGGAPRPPECPVTNRTRRRRIPLHRPNVTGRRPPASRIRNLYSRNMDLSTRRRTLSQDGTFLPKQCGQAETARLDWGSAYWMTARRVSIAKV